MQLHLCWLVDGWKPSRERYLRAWQARGFDCTLWHSGQMTTPPGDVTLRNAAEIMRGSLVADAYAYELRHRNHAACADLFRFTVLHALGGAYVDIDVLPGAIASHTLQGPLFGKPTILPGLEIRFVVASQGHPLLQRIVEQLRRNESDFIDAGGYQQLRAISVVDRTGPVAVAKVVREYAKLTGQSYESFILPNVTLDNTPENTREHHNLRFPEIRAIAKQPLPHPWFRLIGFPSQ